MITGTDDFASFFQENRMDQAPKKLEKNASASTGMKIYRKIRKGDNNNVCLHLWEL